MRKLLTREKSLACAIFWVALSSSVARAAPCPAPLAGGTVSANATITAGDYDCSAVDIIVNTNVILTIAGDPATNSGVVIRAKSFTLASGAKLDGVGQGYPKNQGPPGYVSINTAGGSHGGVGGGNGGAAAYGNYLAPTTLGGGGAGGNGASAGGSAIHLIVTNTLTVDGMIDMSGKIGGYYDGGGGSGAGGSIWIEAGSLVGSGGIYAYAQRGDINSAAGAGGRIAVYAGATNFTGYWAAGGTSYPAGLDGGIGTIFVFNTATSEASCVTSGIYTWNAADLTGVESVRVDGGCDLRITGAKNYLGSVNINAANSKLYFDSNVTLGGDINVSNSGTFRFKKTVSAANVTLSSSGIIYVVGDTTNGLGGILNVSGNMSVATGTKVTGSGYAPLQGPPGYPANWSGGGHGGAGAGTVGPTYDSLTAPVMLGAGSGNCNVAAGQGTGVGGGAIKLVVTGTLDVDGSINMNGDECVGDGAAGGSILIQAGVFSGDATGALSAAGGYGQYTWDGHWGGGGGRIAVFADVKTYQGSISVPGGYGKQGSGTAGTIFTNFGGLAECLTAGSFTWPASDLTLTNSLNIDNGCNLTITGDKTFTGSLNVGATSASTLYFTNNITVGGDINVRHGSTFKFRKIVNASNITLADNSVIYVVGDVAEGTGGTLNVSGTVAIPSGSSVTGSGYSAMQGPPGYPANWGAGGHGGKGAGASGGPVYGSWTQPVTLGAGSGNCNVAGGQGTGVGGGAIKIVAGTLDLSGSINMSGESCVGDGAAGGSIWIDVGTFAGGATGAVAANGGVGQYTWENHYGGGAGRIAIYANARTFAGTVSVAGAYGKMEYGQNGSTAAQYGGLSECTTPGTFTWPVADLVSVTSLTVDNGCNLTITGAKTFSGSISVGANASSTLYFDSNTSVGGDITVANGSTFKIKKTVSMANLTFSGNSSMFVVGDTTTGTGGTIIASGNVTIPTGSAVTGSGYPMLQAPAGYPGSWTAGGHGGKGGGASGGPIYDSLTAPVYLGAGSGSCSIPDGGGTGAGGGAIKFVVTGTLALGGSINMNGDSCRTAGGAGGSIWIDAGTFTGAGALSVNGGMGQWNYENGRFGGGAGIIAVYSTANSFTGTMSAAGGYGGGGGTGDSTTPYAAVNAKYTSLVLDMASSSVVLGNLTYDALTPGSSAILIEVRGGNTPAPDGAWGTWVPVANNGSLAVAGLTGNRYLQYRATLNTTDPVNSKPELRSITLGSSSCYSTGTYYTVSTTSANRFTSARTNTATSVSVTSSAPADTDLKGLLSFDGGVTWNKHNGSTWVNVAGGLAEIGTAGNTMAQIASGLDGFAFGSIPTVDFAFGLKADGCGATPDLTSISFNY